MFALKLGVVFVDLLEGESQQVFLAVGEDILAGDQILELGCGRFFDVIFNNQGAQFDVGSHVERPLVELQSECLRNKVDKQLIGLLALRVGFVQRALQLVDSELELEVALVWVDIGFLLALAGLILFLILLADLLAVLLVVVQECLVS